MDKKAKIATITALVIAMSILALTVFAAPKKCNNGVDDDNDGLVDYPNDPGCSGKQDNTETGTSLVCDNGADATNDRDTLADFRLSSGDPGCNSTLDTSEIDGQCDDLSDNDADTHLDFTATGDSKCVSFSDNDESPKDSCSDTDGGQISGTQGTVSGDDESVPYSLTDFCVDTVTLTEYYCGTKAQDYAPLNTNINCAMNQTTSCSNGACV